MQIPLQTRESAGQPLLFWGGSLVLIVSILAGGGRGGLGDVLAQELAIALLAIIGWRGAQHQLTWRCPPWVRWLPVLALALPIFQLMPIPATWWASTTARAELAGQLLQAGVAPIQVVSLNPGATERALWSLLPAAALFLTVLVLPRRDHRALMVAIVTMAVLSVIFGMAQLAGGPDSPLRLYHPTNPTEAVGFFANRNHLASLLAMALPLALAGTAWAVTERLAGRRFSIFWILTGCAVVILIVLGIALARSRAGLLLGMLAVLGSLPMVLSLRRQRGTKRILAITLGIAVMLSVQFALFGILQRMETDPLDDGRWQYSRVTREAAAAYWPLGSGLGTFRQAYQPFEAKGSPESTIINHAHNDYLELWLEGGLAAILLLLAGAAAWTWCGLRVWRRIPDPGSPDSLSRLICRAAWLSASVGVLHSAFDYPLRTSANMAVFASLAAIAFTGVRGQGARSSD